MSSPRTGKAEIAIDQDPPKAEAAPAVKPEPLKTAGQDRTVADDKQTAEVGQELIPAGARYVQVGVYAGQARQAEVAARLSALGYPVVRSKKAQSENGGYAIMAGPFGDRRSIVAALTRLRRSGFNLSVVR